MKIRGKNKFIEAHRSKKIVFALLCIGIFMIFFVNNVNATGWTVSLNDSLSHYYKLDNSDGVVLDSIGTKNGTNQGVTRGVTGKNGTAFEWDGSDEDDYINLTDIWNGSSDFSVSLWINTSRESDYFFSLGAPNNGSEFRIIGSDLKTISVTEKHGAGAEASITGTTLINDSAWHLVIITWDVSATDLRLYVDNTTEGQDTTGSRTYTADSNWVLGIRDKGSGFQQEMIGKLDEIGIWTKLLTTDDRNNLWNDGDGITYGVTGEEEAEEETSTLNVTLISPIDNSIISTTFQNLTANYTTSVLNLTNATFYIWNVTGGTFNDTVVTTMSGTSNSTTGHIEGFILGEYLWNVYACGENATGTLCEFADANYTLTVGINIGSESYNLKSYETENETFRVNITLFGTSTFHSSNLIYNGTEYAVSDIQSLGSGKYSLTKNIDLPVNPSMFENTSNDFYWNFVFVDPDENQFEQNSSLRQQNVTFINLQLCNDTYPDTTLNFTYFDELNGEQINATTNATSIRTTFNYWLGSGTTYKNYSYLNLTNEASNQYEFCIFPANKTFNADMDMEYEAADYSPRKYFLNSAVLTNQTNEISLILLPIDYSVKFFVTVKQGLEGFSNAYITISKYFVGEGIYKTIGIRKTDDTGLFIEYFDIDKDYKFKIIRDGIDYGTLDQYITCEEAPCELTLQLEEAEVDLWSGYYDVFAPSVSYSLTYNDTLKMVTYDFTDLTGLAQYFRLLVTKTKYNQTSEIICDDKLYTTSGTLYCNMTGYSGDFSAAGYIHRSPERFVDYISFFIGTIKDVLGETGLLISLFLIVTIALVGCWNPAVGVVLVAFAVFGMKILGFAAFSYTTVILVVLIAIILAVKMKT